MRTECGRSQRSLGSLRLSLIVLSSSNEKEPRIFEALLFD